MPRIHFVATDGAETTVDAEPDANLLRIAQAAGLPLEGTCEGQMACSTCHVIVDAGWFDRLPQASEDEEDMLDLAAGVCRTSRLSCQITATAATDGLVVHLPAVARDMRPR